MLPAALLLFAGSITPKPQPGNPQPRVFRLKELKWVLRQGKPGPCLSGGSVSASDRPSGGRGLLHTWWGMHASSQHQQTARSTT